MPKTKKSSAIAPNVALDTASGIGKLSADQHRLQADIASTNNAIAQQKARLEALANAGNRKAQLQKSFNGIRATAGHLAMAGAAGVGTAYAVRRGVAEPLHQIRENETTRARIAALGLKADETQQIIAYSTRVLGFAATAVMWLGRALLLNPIGPAVTVIATAAFLICKYWGPISGFFVGLWERAKGAFAAFWQYLGGSMPAALATVGVAIVNWSPLGLFYQAFAGVMQWFGIELPAKFTTFGAQMMQGLVSGITSMLGTVQDTISGAADSTVGWFKEKLGIRSPSRVFMQAGENIVEGAAIGIDRTRPLLRAAALGLAGATAVAMPAMAAEFPRAPGNFDTRAPLAAAPSGRAAGGVVVQGDTITIHITAAPGADAAQLARAIRAELDKRDADKRARARGAFIDYDN